MVQIAPQYERRISDLNLGLEGAPFDRARSTRDAVPFTADYILSLALAGRLWVFGDGDQNDTVTGQTSFANTTPTWLLDVPAEVVAIPLFMDMSQTGTVAGGDIELLFEYQGIKRYASGGTSEKGLNVLTSVQGNPICRCFSNPTAVAGFGMTVFRADIAPDVSPAEGILPGPLWTPVVPNILAGPASFLIYSAAGTTGPTWFWNLCIAELPRGWAP